MNEWHLERIASTENFDDNFAAVADFHTEVGDSQGRATALVWVVDQDSKNQAAGVDVLGVLAYRNHDVFPELLAATKAVSPAHTDQDLRWSAAHALSCYPDPRALEPLLTFERDPDSDVRWQVAAGLSSLVIDTNPADPGVQALVRLLEDPDEDVRDQALIGLHQLGLRR